MISSGRNPAIRLVQTASEQTTLEGIAEMLKVVAEELQAWGAVIWMASPGSDVERGTGRLFVLGFWVTDPGIQVWHELTFNSMAGWVLCNNKPDCADISDPRIATPRPKFLQQSRSTQFCLAPMRMADGSAAVLEVYRVENRPFTEDEINLLDQLATILPALYATLTDRVGFALQDRISDIRRKADRTEITARAAVKMMLEGIADAFRCLEVSLFLQDVDDEVDIFPLYEYKVVWEGPWVDKSCYRLGEKDEGATGYAIREDRTIRIVDLGMYEQDRAWIQKKYPGLGWNDSLRIRDRARDYFEINDPESSPPVSFVCAPVRSGAKKLGAIRCAGSQRNPFYFDQWHERLLEGVAARIGAWWHNHLRERRKEEDLAARHKLMRGMEAMNRFVQRQLSKHSWDESAFFREAMRLAHEVIPNTDNSDVRLVDGEDLLTVAVYGRDWDRFPQFGKSKRWPLDPPGSAACDLVVNKKGVCVFDNMKDASNLSRIFPDTIKLILAPITTGDQIVGVLCIRSKSPRPFPGYTDLIAGLLGQQLGLYHSLATQIRDLQEAEKSKQKVIETQARTIGDVHHQVKSPILSIYRTAQTLMNRPALSPNVRSEIGRVRSLSSKVSRVVRNMGVFSDLSTGKAIQLRKSLLERERFVQSLREACDDHKAVVDPSRGISFALDEKSLGELAGKDRAGKLVNVDTALLEQCVNNLLDNAAKYSYPQTTVRVSGGIQARGEEYFVSVENEGFAVKPEDVPRMKQRGYRSDKAVWSTAEGSGIGLWIVDEIMRAHQGRLAITPTNSKGITDVRLVFPVTKGITELVQPTPDTGRRR